MQSELFGEISSECDRIQPGQLGESITTAGIELLKLGRGTKLRFVEVPHRACISWYEPILAIIGFLFEVFCAPAGFPEKAPTDLGAATDAIVVVTGLRNPCRQVNAFREGLKEKVVVRDANRKIINRKIGLMSIVETGGLVKPECP